MSSTKKRRTEIDQHIAAEVQFAFDRTCCVCRVKSKPYQLHHIDENPGNGTAENLAVLCLDCHHQTQLRGGFGRRLDAAQIRTYKIDWLARVENKRDKEQGAVKPKQQIAERGIRYMQLHDRNDKLGYEFHSDYPLFKTGDEDTDAELDIAINFHILASLQRLRGIAFSRRGEIENLREQHPGIFLSYHQVAFEIHLFTATMISIEFHHNWYLGGAAHPNHNVDTLNFRLAPVLQLTVSDLFIYPWEGIASLAQSCIQSLIEQKRNKFTADADIESSLKDLWVADAERGASANIDNYKRFVLTESGLRIHFDPYQVGSYAEGAYQVDLPWQSLKDLIEPDTAAAMRWIR